MASNTVRRTLIRALYPTCCYLFDLVAFCVLLAVAKVNYRGFPKIESMCSWASTRGRMMDLAPQRMTGQPKADSRT